MKMPLGMVILLNKCEQLSKILLVFLMEFLEFFESFFKIKWHIQVLIFSYDFFKKAYLKLNFFSFCN